MKFKIDWPNRGHGYTQEEIDAVVKVMQGRGEPLTNGTNVRLFEKEFSQFVGSREAFALMSCAHALDITAMLADIQSGDEVIIPAHTYCATALAFLRRGAVIRWGDIDPDSLTMTLDSVKALVTKKTKAIVLVHLYGLLSPHTRDLAQYARNNGLILIEDCAQSFGARLDGQHCGTFGDIGCFSFHAQKNLTTLGEGGMLIVKDSKLAAKVPGLRLNGHAPFTAQDEYWLPAMTNVAQDIQGIWPMKSTMTEAQAVVGRLVLKRVDSLTGRRRTRGMMFRKAMESYPELRFQAIHQEEAHSHHLLPARYEGKGKSRDDLIRILSGQYGIKAIVQYYPLNRYELFSKNGLGSADVPNTDAFFDNMISFPFSDEIDDEKFNYLMDSVRESLDKLRE